MGLPTARLTCIAKLVRGNANIIFIIFTMCDVKALAAVSPGQFSNWC